MRRWFGREVDPWCPPTTALVIEPDYPRFCSVCGSALVYECDPIGFFEETGAPRFYRWAHCPKWTGREMKMRSPKWVDRAASLDPTFTKRLYPHSALYDTFYLDCTPAYVYADRKPGADCPEPPKRKRASR